MPWWPHFRPACKSNAVPIGQNGAAKHGKRAATPSFLLGVAYFDANLPGLSAESHRYRDGDINACIPTMTALADRGYFVLRMGAKVETALPNLGSKVIDYASQHRNEFLDIFLRVLHLY